MPAAEAKSREGTGLEDRARARLGSLVAKYRLDGLLGVGGTAAVYLATHRNGNRVALKMLHPELALEPDIRSRFLREGYVANRIDHPGATRVLDDDVTEDGAVFLVLDLLKGETLDARWERAGRRLPARDVCVFAHELLSVLEAAHAKGIVHRDIKPDNLFLTIDGSLKVLDFGIARLRDPEAESHTQSGQTFGTPAFMGPEQARGRKSEVDAQSDVWAVGATMYTLISGKYVHEGAETAQELLIASATQGARPLAHVAEEVPRPVAAVVDRALAFSKVDRWPSAAAMRVALAHAYHETYASPMPAHGPPADPAAPWLSPDVRSGAVASAGRRRGLAVAAAASALTALVLAAVVVRFASSPAKRAPQSGASAVAAVPDSPGKSPSTADSRVPTVDLASLPAVDSARSPAPGSRPSATVPPSKRASAAATAPPPVCSIESYVEFLKGEPITRYRQVCH